MAIPSKFVCSSVYSSVQIHYYFCLMLADTFVALLLDHKKRKGKNVTVRENHKSEKLTGVKQSLASPYFLFICFKNWQNLYYWIDDGLLFLNDLIVKLNPNFCCTILSIIRNFPRRRFTHKRSLSKNIFSVKQSRIDGNGFLPM